jgi:hypothetical protein
MPLRTLNFSSLRQKLMASEDGIETHRLIARLLRAGDDHAADVRSILAEYAASGPLDHCRTHAMAQLAKIVAAGDLGCRSAFELGLVDPHLAYWSLEGLVKVLGAASYSQLVAFALDPSHKTEDRSKAIRELAIDSGQHFIRGLPSDPGRWRDEQLPLTEIGQWQEAGFPKGPGFDQPIRHPKLDTPESTIDLLASRLDTKLSKSRRQRQDVMNPTDWLTPSSVADLTAVRALWPLPTVYLEFLSKFSPLRVTIENRRYYQGLRLYGAAELISGQLGYSRNAATQEALADWPANYVVIADHAADPFVLDLTDRPVDDARILTAMHGTGSWDFRKEAPSFLAFLERLAR